MTFILYVLMNRSSLYVTLEVWTIIHNCIAYLFIYHTVYTNLYIWTIYLLTISLKTLIYFKKQKK